MKTPRGTWRRRILLAAFAGLFLPGAAIADDLPPEAAAAKAEEARSEVLLRLGNESNPVDGVFGPFTYGLRGGHRFDSGYAVEAGYIRMHEPGTPSVRSVLDEAQMTLKMPERPFCALDVTAWKNRMIDMYTNLIGVEVTREGEPSFTVGAFAGTATREEISGNFRGFQLGLSVPTGAVDWDGACLFGGIDRGAYRKCAIEAGIHFRGETRLPLTVTFSLEERFFDFGKGGPASEPRDEYVFISGLELHWEKLLF